MRFTASKLWWNISVDPTATGAGEWNTIWSYIHLLRLHHNKHTYQGPLISLNLIIPNLTLFHCNRTLDSGVPILRKNCGDYSIYYSHINETYESIPSECSTIQPPLQGLNITAEFDLEVHVSDVCSSCYSRGGLCELDNKGKFHCTITEKGIDIGITHKFLVLHTLKMLSDFFAYKFLYILML